MLPNYYIRTDCPDARTFFSHAHSKYRIFFYLSNKIQINFLYDISITYSENFEIGQTLNVNESKTLKFVVKWNIDSTLQEPKAINFKAELNYEQDVQEYNPDI